MAQASAEKLEHTGPADKDKVASVPQRVVGKDAGAALAKGTEPSVQIPNHEGGESQGGQEPHLSRREGDQSESIKRKGWAP